MSRDASIRLPFGLEDRTFRLGLGEWRAVQEATGCGPFEITARLGLVVAASAIGLGNMEGMIIASTAKLRVDDIRAVLYHGLIGGGLTPAQAGPIIREMVDQRPPAERVPIAYRVAMAGVAGVEDEPMGEAEGAASSELSSRPSQMAN